MKGVCAVLSLRVEFHLKLIVGIPRISVLVLLSSCFMKYISGSRYGPGVSSRASQGLHTHDSASLSHHVTLSPIDSENLVCCFVLLYRYWGLATVLGFPQKRAKEHVPFLLSTKWIGNLNVLPRPVSPQGAWGGQILILHLSYVAGFSIPIPSSCS